MSSLSTGQSRGQRGATPPGPPAYPRIVQAESESSASADAFDLFAFDVPVPEVWRDPRIAEIVPVAAISAEDVLRLAAQVAWPEGHPVALAMRAAWTAAFPDGTPELKRSGIWHLSTERGVHGYLNGFHVLIGNEQLMRDAGIILRESVRDLLASHEQRGWQSVLVGARAPAVDREDVHRSLIGVLALALSAPANLPAEAPGPGAPSETLDETRVSAAVPASAVTFTEAPAPTIPPARLEPDPPTVPWSRRLPWRRIAALAAAAAAVGIYASVLTVSPDQVAVVRRFGHVVAVCPAGVHFRSLWPIETVTYLPARKTEIPAEGSPVIVEPPRVLVAEQSNPNTLVAAGEASMTLGSEELFGLLPHDPPEPVATSAQTRPEAEDTDLEP